MDENNFQKSCNIPHYIVYLHQISSEKCQAWHKSEVISAYMRIERNIINKFKNVKKIFRTKYATYKLHISFLMFIFAAEWYL